MTRPDPARRTSEDDSLSIYPHQVHIGDRFSDADTDGAAEWEVVARPVSSRRAMRFGRAFNGQAIRPRPGRSTGRPTTRSRYDGSRCSAAPQRLSTRPTTRRLETGNSGGYGP